MGIFSKLFGAQKKSQVSSQKHALDIVTDFGRLLETSPPPPSGMVADVNELPHPKDDIKKALHIILLTIDDVATQKQLFEAYYSLACWQPGVGAKRIEVDFSHAPSSTRKQESLEKIDVFLKTYEKWKEWEPVVEREQAELLQDLAKLGFK